MSDEAKIPAVSPYLTVKGVRKAIEFYKTVFDAKLGGIMDAEDGKRVMHATVLINGNPVMMSDEFPEFSPFRAPTGEPISPVAISVRYEKAADIDRVHDLAIKNGATTSWKPEDMFWGDRFCQIIDPFHHRWMLVAKL